MTFPNLVGVMADIFVYELDSTSFCLQHLFSLFSFIFHVHYVNDKCQAKKRIDVCTRQMKIRVSTLKS